MTCSYMNRNNGMIWVKKIDFQDSATFPTDIRSKEIKH